MQHHWLGFRSVLLTTVEQVAIVAFRSVQQRNNYVRPRNTRTEMYTGRVACCHLVSHVEYAPRTLLRLEKGQDRQTDGQTPDRYITLTARRICKL